MSTEITATIKVVKDNTAAMKLALRSLRGSRVLVGVPRDAQREVGWDSSVGSGGGTTKRRKQKVSNALLAYVHNNGSPAQNIPARPTIEPGIKDAQIDIASYMKQAGDAALSGDDARMERGLEAVGIKAVTAIKKRIRSNTPPPLADSTIAARQRRGVHRTNTLVDTGQYLNAHTFIVKKVRVK